MRSNIDWISTIPQEQDFDALAKLKQELLDCLQDKREFKNCQPDLDWLSDIELNILYFCICKKADRKNVVRMFNLGDEKELQAILDNIWDKIKSSSDDDRSQQAEQDQNQEKLDLQLSPANILCEMILDSWKFSEQEKQIIKVRYGIWCAPAKCVKDILLEFNITQAQFNYIVYQKLNKIINHILAKIIKSSLSNTDKQVLIWMVDMSKGFTVQQLMSFFSISRQKYLELFDLLKKLWRGQELNNTNNKDTKRTDSQPKSKSVIKRKKGYHLLCNILKQESLKYEN